MTTDVDHADEAGEQIGSYRLTTVIQCCTELGTERLGNDAAVSNGDLLWIATSSMNLMQMGKASPEIASVGIVGQG